MRGVSPRSRSPSSQTSGASRRSRQSCAGVTRTAQKRARHGAFVPLRHDTRRHAPGGWAAPHARASTVAVSAARLGRVRGRPRPPGGGAACRRGVPRKTLRSDDTPSAYGSRARCSVRRSVALSPNSASPTTAVTVIRAARTWRSKVSASCHLGTSAAVAGMRARARWVGVSHASGRYRRAPSSHACRPVHSATVTAVWQFAILPSAPQVLAGDAHRRGPLLRKARPVEDQDPRPIGHDLAEPLPDRLGVPRRVGDEMLERLIGAGVAEARPHRLHRLARAVAQQPGHVATQRAALTLTTEAVLEPLQPGQQPAQPRGRGVIQHRSAAYRTREKSTMPSKVITRAFPRQFVDLTKSY